VIGGRIVIRADIKGIINLGYFDIITIGGGRRDRAAGVTRSDVRQRDFPYIQNPLADSPPTG
jgi:hypothetical protein